MTPPAEAIAAREAMRLTGIGDLRIIWPYTTMDKEPMMPPAIWERGGEMDQWMDGRVGQ